MRRLCVQWCVESARHSAWHKEIMGAFFVFLFKDYVCIYLFIEREGKGGRKRVTKIST